jgi:hypothetical protein
MSGWPFGCVQIRFWDSNNNNRDNNVYKKKDGGVVWRPKLIIHKVDSDVVAAPAKAVS